MADWGFIGDMAAAVGESLRWMFNRLMDIYYDIEVCFERNLDLYTLFRVYWYLFLIEFPRYYLLETVICLWYKITEPRRRRFETRARMVLFAENPLVSILVPGKNEGRHIYKLAMSLREQTYGNYEIIVVDDGSDDATPLICSDLERNGFIDRFIRMNERGGKASAANMALYFARGKYVIHMDADSSLDRDAIEKILLPFYLDSKVRAVGGCIKVRNDRDTICSSLQALEYLKVIMVGRIVTNELGIYHIISGAFGAFDREVLKNVGMWDTGPGLDGDITQKIRKAGYKISFANNAVCLTNVPTTWFALYRQRRRWSRSLVRFRIRKHRDILMPNSNWQFSNFLSNLESILYDCVFNYLWFYYIIGLLFGYTDRLLEILVVGWLIRLFFTILAFSVAMMVSERRREELRLAKYLPLSTFYTGYFLRITRLIGYTAELFFFNSFRDNWNPRKTSIWAQAHERSWGRKYKPKRRRSTI